MGFAPKEQDVERMVKAHLDKVGECLACFEETLAAYLGGDGKQAWTLWERLDKLESDADKIRRDIVKTLYEGAFLPLTREDIMAVAMAVDEIANVAEEASDSLILTQPQVPDSLKEGLMELARQAAGVLPALRDAAAGIFVDFAKVAGKLREVKRGESAVDDTEWHLVRDVFATDLELSQKMLLREIISEIANIADHAENAADRLQTLVVKKQF